MRNDAAIGAPHVPHGFRRFFNSSSPFYRRNSPFRDSPFYRNNRNNGNNNRRRGFVTLNSNIVVSTSGNCIIAGGRIISGTAIVGIRLDSNHGFSTGVINGSPHSSVTLVRVRGPGGLATVGVTSSSTLHINSCAMTVNGPFNLNRAMASKVISTLKHDNLGTRGCRGFVRASTTVGHNGSNNTLIGLGNRLVNVGATVLTPSNNGVNVNFTVPDGVIGGLASRVIRCNRIGHNRLNVVKARLGSRLTGTVGISTRHNTFMDRILPGSSTTGTNVGTNSIVASLGNGPVDDFTTLHTRINAVPINDGLALNLLHSNGRIGIGLRLRRDDRGRISSDSVFGNVRNTRVDGGNGSRNIMIGGIGANAPTTRVNLGGNSIVVNTGRRTIGGVTRLHGILSDGPSILTLGVRHNSDAVCLLVRWSPSAPS